MRHIVYIVSAVFLLVGLVISATKTSYRVSVPAAQQQSEGDFRYWLFDDINKIVNDIDTTYAHVSTIETATSGVATDSIFKTAIKATRLRGDSTITTAVKATRLRADSTIITAITGTRAYLSLTNYADSAAARTAGVVNGQLYHVAGTVKIMY